MVGANTRCTYLSLAELNGIFLPGKNALSNLSPLKLSLTLLTFCACSSWGSPKLAIWSSKQVRMWRYDVQAAYLFFCCVAGSYFSFSCVEVEKWKWLFRDQKFCHFTLLPTHKMQYNGVEKQRSRQTINEWVEEEKTCNGEWGIEIRRKLWVVKYFHS